VSAAPFAAWLADALGGDVARLLAEYRAWIAGDRP